MQRCRNGFFAEVCSGDRPVFRILQQISCEQTDVGILIGEIPDYAGVSLDLLVPLLNHARGRDFPGVQIRKTIKGQRIYPESRIDGCNKGVVTELPDLLIRVCSATG